MTLVNTDEINSNTLDDIKLFIDEYCAGSIYDMKVNKTQFKNGILKFIIDKQIEELVWSLGGATDDGAKIINKRIKEFSNE